MRKTVPMKLGDLWGDFVRNTPRVARGLAEAKAAGLWAMVVGPAVAAHTVEVTVRDGILTAKLSSSVVRSELFMQRDALREAINRAAGEPVIRTVILK
ncbi:MAG: DUF721 domain-containing protein [Rikenellaceae bacterium]|nr:DUF721 domain-containing protein [Rikenellaceae bacterium]